MKTDIKIMVTLCLAAGLATGCGDSFKTTKKGKKAEQISMDLNGIWESSCHKNDWFDFSQSRERYTFGALGDFDLKMEISSDDCQTIDQVMELYGTYDDLGASAAQPEAKNINFTLSKATITPKSEEAVKVLNRIEYCSIKEWAVDKKVDVTDKECAGTSYRKGDVILDLYRLEENRLYFGKRFFTTTPAPSSDRPTEVDKDRTFNRI
jgi:hypothetical protein